MDKILLLGGGYQAISVSHSLAKDYQITILGSDKIAKYGKDINKFVNASLDNPIDFKQKLFHLLDNDPHLVIIPMGDKMAEFLSMNKDEIEEKTSAKCAIESYSKFSIVYNKASLMSLCEYHDIPHPITQVVTGDLTEMINVPFPALIKPNHSVGARGITLVSDENAYKNKIKTIIKEYGDCTLQEYINNKNYYYNVMLYRDKDGKFPGYTITKILRFYPLKGGSSCYCQTIKNERLLEICKRTLDILNWNGFADFDVLEKEDNDFRIIEINPRVPASLRAAEVSNVHFPQIIISDVLRREIPKFRYISGKALRYIGLDIAWFLTSPNRFKTSPSWFNFWDKDTYSQEGGLREWKSTLVSMWIGIEKFIKKNNGNH